MGLNHDNAERLLIVENLEKVYAGRGVLGTKKEVIALQGVSFAIRPESTLALVGESGSIVVQSSRRSSSWPWPSALGWESNSSLRKVLSS